MLLFWRKAVANKLSMQMVKVMQQKIRGYCAVEEFRGKENDRNSIKRWEV